MTDFILTPLERELRGRIEIPGDKSIGHRAFLIGALAKGSYRVTGLSGGEDNLRTVDAMRALGVAIEQVEGGFEVQGVGVDGLMAPKQEIYCGNSGTSMRLLCGLLAGQPFESQLSGDESLTRRPMRRVTGPLSTMGARFEGQPGSKESDIYPPLRCKGVAPASRLQAVEYDSPIASAQVKSALMLAALQCEGRTQIREPRQSRDHSEKMFAYLGLPVEVHDKTTVVVNTAGWDRQSHARDIVVPGDPSSAAFVVAAGVIAHVERITCGNVCINPSRTGFFDALAKMMALVEFESRDDSGVELLANIAVSRGAGDMLQGARIDGELTVRAIDELPILAVVAARARGETQIADAAELRVKESDRIASTVMMLRALGVEVEELDDGMVIQGQGDTPFRACEIDSHGDHRIAMAGAIAGLVADGNVKIRNVENVATSFPGFAEALSALGADVQVVK